MFDCGNMTLLRALNRRLQSTLRKSPTPAKTAPSHPLTKTFNETTDSRKSLGRNVRWALPRRTSHADFIVLICLSYSNERWPEGGTMHLEGPKNDLLLLLNHLNYRHENDNRQFFVMTDFPLVYVDSSGVGRTMPTILPTRHNIETLVLGIMRDLQSDDKVHFYFGGHMGLDLSSTDHPTDQYLLLTEEDRIYGHEFRRWLSQARDGTIIVVIDAPHSGGFLGLEYSDRISRQTPAVAEDKMTSLVIEISATKKGEVAFSGKLDTDSDSIHGLLTWHLVQLLEAKSEIPLPDLGDYLRDRCSKTWVDNDNRQLHQSPQISSSRKIRGSIALF